MPRGGTPKKGFAARSAAIKHVTSGTYNIVHMTTSGEQYEIATENEVAAVATYIVASGKDEMFSWVRFNAYIFSACAMIYEWALIRCKATDSLQDLDDSATVEYLLKEKRLVKRGFRAVEQIDNGSPPLQKLSWELFGLKLADGEELRMVIRPIYPADTGASVYELGTLEWRKVGN